MSPVNGSFFLYFLVFSECTKKEQTIKDHLKPFLRVSVSFRFQHRHIDTLCHPYHARFKRPKRRKKRREKSLATLLCLGILMYIYTVFFFAIAICMVWVFVDSSSFSNGLNSKYISMSAYSFFIFFMNPFVGHEMIFSNRFFYMLSIMFYLCHLLYTGPFDKTEMQ